MNRYWAFLLALTTSYIFAGDLPPVQETDGPVTGFNSVTEALAALRLNPDVEERQNRGWLIFEDRAHLTIWSFTPKNHPAYPAAVKRVMTEGEDGWYIEMFVQCEASKSACDQLVRDFQQLNNQMTNAIQEDIGNKPQN